jgi:hypothetical protein
LDIGKLNGVNIDSHHCVMSGKSHRSAASRGNAEDTTAGLEHTTFNFGVLIHASE